MRSLFLAVLAALAAFCVSAGAGEAQPRPVTIDIGGQAIAIPVFEGFRAKAEADDLEAPDPGYAKALYIYRKVTGKGKGASGRAMAVNSPESLAKDTLSKERFAAVKESHRIAVNLMVEKIRERLAGSEKLAKDMGQFFEDERCLASFTQDIAYGHKRMKYYLVRATALVLARGKALTLEYSVVTPDADPSRIEEAKSKLLEWKDALLRLNEK